MTRHYNKLRSYALDVTRDLVQQGTIKQKSGQALSDVLRSEIGIVIEAVLGDVRTLAAEAGEGAISVGASMVADGLAAAGKTLVAKLFGGR